MCSRFEPHMLRGSSLRLNAESVSATCSVFGSEMFQRFMFLQVPAASKAATAANAHVRQISTLSICSMTDAMKRTVSIAATIRVRFLKIFRSILSSGFNLSSTGASTAIAMHETEKTVMQKKRVSTDSLIAKRIAATIPVEYR